MATLADLVPAVVKLLGNRADVAALAPEQLGNAITEFTDNYPFEELRETGPLVQFTPGVNTYTPSFFLQPSTTPGRVFNKIISWFFYLQPPISLGLNPNIGYANPGYNMRYRDIEDMETLANTVSLPQFWSQLGETSFIVAATPQQAYFTYVRYQYKQLFTEPTPVASDPFSLPPSWYDIAQYTAAERIALQLRMQDVADRYHRILFGDPEFQRSSGKRGQPGLIAARTSQTTKNQSRSTRSVRLMGRSQY